MSTPIPQPLEPGIRGRLERVVDDAVVTRHVGGAGVFSTPAMIGLMEITCHDSVAPRLAPGQTTVGFEVHVRHLAPTEPGRTVVVETLLTEVDGRRLVFEVSCHEGEKLVGQGTHRRAVVAARG